MGLDETFLAISEKAVVITALFIGYSLCTLAFGRSDQLPVAWSEYWPLFEALPLYLSLTMCCFQFATLVDRKRQQRLISKGLVRAEDQASRSICFGRAVQPDRARERCVRAYGCRPYAATYSRAALHVRWYGENPCLPYLQEDGRPFPRRALCISGSRACEGGRPRRRSSEVTASRRVGLQREMMD